jgi:hypothetical protein
LQPIKQVLPLALQVLADALEDFSVHRELRGDRLIQATKMRSCEDNPVSKMLVLSRISERFRSF